MWSKLLRIISPEGYKGTVHYVSTQRTYALIRTILYFGISLSLFAAGYFSTGSKVNLLSIVAVLGCLPASKSAVNYIMFLRYKSLSDASWQKILPRTEGLNSLNDMVFTTYSASFVVGHLVIRDNTVCGFSEDPAFAEKEFQTFIQEVFKADSIKNVSVKVFTALDKYLDRIDQLGQLESNGQLEAQIAETLKSVVL